MVYMTFKWIKVKANKQTNKQMIIIDIIDYLYIKK